MSSASREDLAMMGDRHPGVTRSTPHLVLRLHLLLRPCCPGRRRENRLDRKSGRRRFARQMIAGIGAGPLVSPLGANSLGDTADHLRDDVADIPGSRSLPAPATAVTASSTRPHLNMSPRSAGPASPGPATPAAGARLNGRAPARDAPPTMRSRPGKQPSPTSPPPTAANERSPT